ncbi:unnamed protein product, partial [Effrenium voratum]
MFSLDTLPEFLVRECPGKSWKSSHVSASSGRFVRPEEPSAMKVDVHLPSGAGCSVTISRKRRISELKAAAQQKLQRRLKLIAEGRQLDLTATLSEAGLRDGDVVAAVMQLGKLSATNRTFAWHGHGGEVVTWGDPKCGDSSQVQEQL